MSAPAGWYAQPDGTQRYWDGARLGRADVRRRRRVPGRKTEVAGATAYPQV
jgi:hypothetical protein